MKARTVMVLALFVAALSEHQISAQTTRYVDNLGDCDVLAPCHGSIIGAADSMHCAASILVRRNAVSQAKKR